MRALIVDDDPIIQMLVSTMLKSKGYEVFSADSGFAIESYIFDPTFKVDLFLIDLQLGEVSGLEVYNIILKPKYPETKVIFMSANSKEDAVAHYGILEDAIFLEKPFKAPDLLGLL